MKTTLEAATTTIGQSIQTKNGSTLKFIKNNTNGNVEVYVNDRFHFSSLKGFGLKRSQRNADTTRAVMIGTLAETSEKGCKVWLNFKTTKTATLYGDRLVKAGVSRVQFTPFKDEK